ncbi:hypothetical protein N473_21020 [Pseudoalteromonas luteoviolacea CPMOR-1]|uniref:Uncharacterized protein n=1 Tax=Pseudoalteromonas luteoviolacea CPMOR-1 TaxID=1365248 RepID=A0A167K2F9_9GAMM|nr:hypothetical protein [Pseudoalteromonas luteoviolacea]KZN62028.1 hypothetical protein N473_21020 [Pseudoalteromonas luteoviolacea CPMOR-1]
MLTRILGYILFVPFIAFYSYVLGPVLKLILIPGGLMLFILILGPEAFLKHWRLASEQRSTDPKSVQESPIG